MALNNIAFINYTASGGGAGRICSILHQAFNDSVLYNKFEHNPLRRIIKIDDLAYRNSVHKICKSLLGIALDNRVPWLPRFLSFLTNEISEPFRMIDKYLGREDFHFPSTQKPERYFISKPNLVHGHNLF
ncbi:MAG: hypothetical protein HOI70_09000, partial [Opitutae bacterium]|nr:hypothetical protein [Opitutae bacterium]